LRCQLENEACIMGDVGTNSTIVVSSSVVMVMECMSQERDENTNEQ